MSLKTWAMLTANAAGIGAALRQSHWRHQRLAILCYHGVSLSDEHEALPELYVTVAALRRRMHYLRQMDFTVLGLSDAIEALFSGQLPPRSVAVTFDDGTKDFIECAVPVLEEFAIPATVYVTTYYGEKKLPVFDTAMRYLLWKARERRLDARGQLGLGPGGPLPLHSEPQRRAAAAAIAAFARDKALTADDKQAILRRFAEAAGIDFEAFLAGGQFHIMTAEQLARLPRPLIGVELHTHRHRTPIDEVLFKTEIADNRASLERSIAGLAPVHFCYPSGDYRRAFLPWLEHLGVRSATTCVPGLATRHSDPLLLPRFVDTLGIDDATFAGWLDGTAEWLPRRRLYRLDPTR